jgi:serine/threonine protein kinase
MQTVMQLIGIGPPSCEFLWPLDLVRSQDSRGFGYLMPLRDARFSSLIDYVRRRGAHPTPRVLATIGLHLSHAFLLLHVRGACYRDINFGNVFFDRTAGDIRICDNDNVAVDGDRDATVYGTQEFMAPEVVRGEALPSARTDLFSLAVLLFYIFHLHHPLRGKRMLSIHCLDKAAWRLLHGDAPLFIFDPVDRSNAAVGLEADDTGESGAAALANWAVYPGFFRNLFIQSFTRGLREPDARVTEGVWRPALVRLRDGIFPCPHCNTQNFYDQDVLVAASGTPGPCYACSARLQLPPRLRIGKHVIMLNSDTQLFRHHIDGKSSYNFSEVVATVSQHPGYPHICGLKNVSTEKWVAVEPNGQVRDVAPGRTYKLVSNATINFGRVQGVIRA